MTNKNNNKQKKVDKSSNKDLDARSMSVRKVKAWAVFHKDAIYELSIRHTKQVAIDEWLDDTWGTWEEAVRSNHSVKPVTISWEVD